MNKSNSLTQDNYYIELLDSPMGTLTLVTDGHALTHLLFEQHKVNHSIGNQSLTELSTRATKTKPNPHGKHKHILQQTQEQLAEYFCGKREKFTLPLNPPGTDFQKKVWQALLDIPYGATSTYGELAQAIKQPTASRAVGLANGKNPISIVIPCHRVIGKNGTLTGYAGGIENKAKLLTLEKREKI